MTCCSTVLALGMMPLLLFIYCKGFPNLHTSVPYAGIIVSLVMILIPSVVGILFNYYRPQYAQIFKKVSTGSDSQHQCRAETVLFIGLQRKLRDDNFNDWFIVLLIDKVMSKTFRFQFINAFEFWIKSNMSHHANNGAQWRVPKYIKHKMLMNLNCFILLLSVRPQCIDDCRCGGRDTCQRWNRRLHPDSVLSPPHCHRRSHALNRLHLRIHHLCALQTQPFVSPGRLLVSRH